MSLKHRPSAALLLVLLGAFALRLLHLGEQSFWWDEALSMLLALAPSIEWRPADAGHPPLYDYAVLKPWLALVGPSEFAARALSVVFGVLAVALAYQLGRRMFGPATGLLGAFLVAVSPIQWWYSQEVRMYTLVACLVLALLTLLVRVLDDPATARWPVWAAIGVLEVAAVYTQYLAAVVVVYVNVVALGVFAWRRDRAALVRWLAAQALAVGLALPFLLPALGQVGGYVPPNATPLGPLPFLIQVWGGFVGGTLALLGGQATFEAFALVAAIAVGVGTVALFALDPLRRRDLLLLSFSLVPLAAVFIIMALRPGFHPRYVVMLSAPWLVYVGRIVAFTWATARWRAVGAAVTAAFVGASAIAIYAILTTPQYQRDDVRALAQRLASTLTANDVVLLDYPDYAMDFYYHGRAPAVTLDIRSGDEAAAAQVAEATQGKQRVAALTWVHSHFDPRGFLPWLLRSSGRKTRDWNVSTLNVDEYRLDTPVVLPDLRPAEARFPGLSLTGAYTPPAVAGRDVRLALRWRNDGAAPAQAKAAVSLVDRRGRVLATRDNALIDAFGQPLATWQPGAEVVNYYSLALPPGTPPLEYDVVVSVYAEDTLKPLSVLDAQGAPGGTRASVGAVRVERNPLPGAPADPTLTVVNREAAPGLTLEGYAVEPREASAGQRLALRLRWRAEMAGLDVGPMRVQLVQDGRVIAEQQGAPADGQYPVEGWSAGEVVLDRREVGVPGGAASGPAQLQVQVGDNAAIALGEVTLRASDRLTTAPAVTNPLDVAVGPAIRLVGYDLSQTRVSPGETLPLTLVWQATGPAGETPLTVFTHLLDRDGRLIAQHDAPPAEGRRPTPGWVEGEYILDPHALTFSQPDYRGPATIEVGLYDPMTGARLPTPDGSGRILLPTTVTVGER